MSAARENATAALLPNGKVLIAGGLGCPDPKHCTGVSGTAGADALASAEIYDPGTGKFTKTGSMSAIREGATATLLSDGKILLAGNSEWADLYDWRSGKFTRSGQDGNIGGLLTATLLPNDKVLVTGGSSEPVALLFDEASGKFTDISLAPPAGTPSATYQGSVVPRVAPSAATLLKDGRVLLFMGGYLETYEPNTGACADVGFISPAGEWLGVTATPLLDGRVLIEGGVFESATYQQSNTRSAALYYPNDRSIRRGSTVLARLYQTATLLPNGDVLIAGGEDDKANPLASAELFKP
jgi:hypothetical protein